MKLSFQVKANTEGGCWVDVHSDKYVARLYKDNDVWVLEWIFSSLKAGEIKQIYKYLKELNK